METKNLLDTFDKIAVKVFELSQEIERAHKQIESVADASIADAIWEIQDELDLILGDVHNVNNMVNDNIFRIERQRRRKERQVKRMEVANMGLEELQIAAEFEIFAQHELIKRAAEISDGDEFAAIKEQILSYDS